MGVESTTNINFKFEENNTMKLLRKSYVAALLLLVVMSAGWGACGKESLVKTNLKVVTGVQTARKITTALHENKQLDDNGYRQRLEAFDRVYKTSDVLADSFEKFQVVTPENKQVFIDNTQEFINALQKLIDLRLVGVKNPATQAEWLTWLNTAYAAASSLKVTLNAVKNPVTTKGLKIRRIKVEPVAMTAPINDGVEYVMKPLYDGPPLLRSYKGEPTWLTY